MNRRHTDFQSVALPTELPALTLFVSIAYVAAAAWQSSVLQLPEVRESGLACCKGLAMTGSRSRKFPLARHKPGPRCKKIQGQLYYFGTDKLAASERYLQEAANLHAGKPRVEDGNWAGITVKDLANRYLVVSFIVLGHYSVRAELPGFPYPVCLVRSVLFRRL